MSILDSAWLRCFAEICGSHPPPCVQKELVAQYNEPHRAYHTTRHLEECFAWFEQARDLAQNSGELAFALFYHDAIYDPHASDNEKRSAELATDILDEYVRGYPEPNRVASLIMTTMHSAVPDGSDAKLLVDIDLSILGAQPARFDEYERQIRIEYEWVSADAFREGRKRVLKQFLDRSTIYSTEFFQQRLETPARANLHKSFRRLEGPI